MKTKDLLPVLLAGQALVILVMLVVLAVLLSLRRRLDHYQRIVWAPGPAPDDDASATVPIRKVT